MKQENGGFATVDVAYPAAGGARAAIVIADRADFAGELTERIAHVSEVAPYLPGQFFLRELPALHAVLAGAPTPRLVIIDGYVDLDPHGRPGLGARLHTAIGIPVIGVAKSSFRTATHAMPLLRGHSARPLFITAAGFPLPQAAELIADMAGPHRLPDALRRVDALARGARQPGDNASQRSPAPPTSARPAG